MDTVEIFIYAYLLGYNKSFMVSVLELLLFFLRTADLLFCFLISSSSSLLLKIGFIS